MVYKYEYFGLVICFLFILGFPVLILSAIFEVETITKNVNIFNFVGQLLVLLIYINCLMIFFSEKDRYSFKANALRLLLVIIGVVIVPLYIGIQHPLRIKEDELFARFYWIMPRK